jgi:shikimate kinase
MTSDSRLSKECRGQGLALIGYRGSGKSTVGKILAERLKRPFLDADVEIEARAGRPIAAIFRDGGEADFRDREAATLASLVQSHPTAVLATGGGAVLRPSNRALLRGFGRLVWLRADPEELARRLASDMQAGTDRPGLTSRGTLDEIAQVLAARTEIYRELADLTVETVGRTPSEVAELIHSSLNDGPESS